MHGKGGDNTTDYMTEIIKILKRDDDKREERQT